jgi:hypothetical protein
MLAIEDGTMYAKRGAVRNLSLTVNLQSLSDKKGRRTSCYWRKQKMIVKLLT